MASFVKNGLVLSVLCWMSFYVEVEADSPCPILTKRTNGINPMTLTIPYCKDTVFLVPTDKTPIRLLDHGQIFKYKVTDVRSKLEYFFDRIHFLVDKKIDQNYPFFKNIPDSDSEVLMLVVNQRTISQNNATATRYLILAVNLVEGTPVKGKGAEKDDGSWKNLLAVISAQDSVSKFSLNKLFPAFGEIKRYELTPTADKCVDGYVYIEFLDSLKLPTEQFADLKNYAISEWDFYKLIGAAYTGPPFSESEMSQQIRFDCQRETNPNERSNGAAEVQFHGQLIGYPILLAMLQIWITSN